MSRIRNIIAIAALFASLGLTYTAFLLWHHPNPINLAIQVSDNATDAPVNMYIQVVDEEGHPLTGVKCSYRLGRFGKTWAVTGNTADRDASVDLAGVTGLDGRLHINAVGSDVNFIRFDFPGYSRLFDKDYSGLGSPYRSETELAYFCLRSHGRDEYKSDPERPAIFVMVKNGTKAVTTLPSAGGSDPPQRIGGPRIRLLPVWPTEPSIPDVQYVSTTLPANP